MSPRDEGGGNAAREASSKQKEEEPPTWIMGGWRQTKVEQRSCRSSVLFLTRYEAASPRVGSRCYRNFLVRSGDPKNIRVCATCPCA